MAQNNPTTYPDKIPSSNLSPEDKEKMLNSAADQFAKFFWEYWLAVGALPEDDHQPNKQIGESATQTSP